MATYIFDFDGTLADSFTLIRDVIIEEYTTLKCRQLTLDDIPLLREMGAREVFQYLEVPLWRRMTFIRKLRKLTHERTHDICLFPEWPDILKRVHSEGHQLGIISSNALKTVMFVLGKYQIGYIFNFIHCDKSLFGKKRCLSQLIRGHQLNRKETYYIGDEVRDIKAAQANNIQAIAVGWGFNSASKLEMQMPQHLILSFAQMKKLLRTC